jgi:hypothetical protein
MADTLSNLHDQMEIDLKQLWTRRDSDMETSRPDGTQQKKGSHDEYVREAWAPAEEAIRDSASQTFRKCCQKEAIDLREKLMLEVPGVSNHEVVRCYSGPIPGRPDLAGRILLGYTQMVRDLRKLAAAYEQKIR